MPVVCKIVREPERDAAVAFDFNPGIGSGAWMHDRTDGFDLGDPGFSVAHDGSLIEGIRDIKLSYIETRSRSQAESTLGACARALTDTSAAWLMWQLDQFATPTFFRLHPSSPGGLDFTWVDANNDDNRVWRWDVTLTADAFAYGERRTYEKRVSYGLTGSTWKLPDPSGDVPTRAKVEVTPTIAPAPANATDMTGCTPMVNFAAFPAGALPDGVQRWEAERFTPRNGYARGTAPLASGSRLSEHNDTTGIECPNASNTGFTGGICMSGAAPTKVPPGTYQVMLRIVNPATTTPVRPAFRVAAEGWGATASTYWQTWHCPTGAGPNSAFAYGSWLNCGQLQIPVGVDPTGLTIEEIDRPEISVYHRGDGTAGRVVIDQVLLVPVDPVTGSASTLFIAWATNSGPTVFGPMTIDDTSYRVGNLDVLSGATPKWRSEAAPRAVGGYPILSPGKDNWLTFLWNVQRDNPTQNMKTFDPHDLALNLKVSWTPRYLHLGSL